eukprot:Pgem_evm1s17939
MEEEDRNCDFLKKSEFNREYFIGTSQLGNSRAIMVTTKRVFIYKSEFEVDSGLTEKRGTVTNQKDTRKVTYTVMKVALMDGIFSVDNIR